jgi:hypothetical protein
VFDGTAQVFSNPFREGQIGNIDDRFPSNYHPYIDDYEYPSDSDLEDESSHPVQDWDEEPELRTLGSQAPTVTSEDQPQPSQDANMVKDENRSAHNSVELTNFSI